jgi:REP element-mobilizing transposase RayT
MSRGFVVGAAPFRTWHGALMPGWRDIRGAMPELPKRATIRWQGYDYANVGAYYLTICTQGRLHLFGRIVNGAMHPSPIGMLAQRCWDAIPEHMPHVDIGEFVVMPNHVHGIVVIRERLVDVRGRAMGGASDVDDVGARHDAPGSGPMDAPNTPTNAPGIGAGDATGETTITNNGSSDDPGTGIPGGDSDTADAHAHHTRARHDAPPRDPRKPPGIPHGALGQIAASYKSAVTRMAYRDGLLPHGTPLWQRNYWDRVIRDEGEYDRIAKYIRDNPANWKGGRFSR